MRKVLSAFLVASVLLLCAAPIFCLAASAPFTFNTSQSIPVADSTHYYYVLAHDDSDGVLVCLESPALQYMTDAGLIFSSDGRPSFYGYSSVDGSYIFNLTYYDLKNGYLLSTETKTKTVFSGDYFWYPNQIFSLSQYVTFPVYLYSISPTSFPSSYPPSPSLYTIVDPFVNWSYTPPDPGPSPGPVDPTSVIRSLIPRPFGNNLVYYIADHEHLYSIFVGHPFSFESQGKIDTSLTPNEYEGEQYNQFSVMMSGSGSGVNLRFTNKCQYPITCYINTYDVIDGSFIRSYSTTVNSGSLDSPSIHNYNLQLSDAATYGIYQSGFFSRDGITSYPELRISWSDTIDYSLDLFVIRSGLVTIVQNQASIISGIGSANSTLSTISTTSASILSSLNAFYSLVDSNWSWFKTTFYNNLNSKWEITNQYLISIYNLLNETDETMTIEDDTSGVAAMESAKNDLVVTNAAGQAVDAGDAAAAGLSQAAEQIGEIAQPVSTINQLMQTIVFDKPKLLLPIIVALGLGLMVTILGKNKSD